MNRNVNNNYSKLKASLFFLPVFIIAIIVLFLYNRDALSIAGYTKVQKDLFFTINHYLGQYPSLQFNLTQFGDVLIFLSFLSILFAYAPKIWESLIAGLLVSLLFSSILKKLFSVPRPAATFKESFIIVGKPLYGHNSLPSGHSITIFTILSVLLFAFMPTRLKYKIGWFFLVIIIGLLLASTRVGVGAHYPIDVITGAAIGYISGVAGIFISRELTLFSWVSHKKYYPVFILFFLTCIVILIIKITSDNLIIFYLPFISLIISLYKTIDVYAKDFKK